MTTQIARADIEGEYCVELAAQDGKILEAWIAIGGWSNSQYFAVHVNDTYFATSDLSEAIRIYNGGKIDV